VDKIFCVHNYSEQKKVAMATLEFDGYALICWEQMVNEREEAGHGTIHSWAKMKRELRARFVPKHYHRDLFDKLQNLKQGSLSVDEYYKEMEKAMIRANVYEDEEQTIARFMSGLHHNIQHIVEFQQYHNLVELVHQASKAERQLQQEYLSAQRVQQVEANLYKEVVQVKVQSPTQVVVHALAILELVAKSWLLQVRKANQQTQ